MDGFLSEAVWRKVLKHFEDSGFKIIDENFGTDEGDIPYFSAFKNNQKFCITIVNPKDERSLTAHVAIPKLLSEKGVDNILENEVLNIDCDGFKVVASKTKLVERINIKDDNFLEIYGGINNFEKFLTRFVRPLVTFTVQIHQLDLSHGDLTDSNILYDPSLEKPVVIDFEKYEIKEDEETFALNKLLDTYDLAGALLLHLESYWLPIMDKKEIAGDEQNINNFKLLLKTFIETIDEKYPEGLNELIDEDNKENIIYDDMNSDYKDFFENMNDFFRNTLKSTDDFQPEPSRKKRKF